MEPAAPTPVVKKPLPDGKSEIPLSTFTYMFNEIVRYYQNQAQDTSDIEGGLHRIGRSMGVRLLELYSLRDGKGQRRVPTPVGMLQFIQTTVWKALFGRPIGGLEKSNQSDSCEYFMFEREPVTNRFASVPRSLGQLNCASLLAGVINGVLDAAGLPSEVAACWNANQTQTVYVVKFLAGAAAAAAAAAQQQAEGTGDGAAA